MKYFSLLQIEEKMMKYMVYMKTGVCNEQRLRWNGDPC